MATIYDGNREAIRCMLSRNPNAFYDISNDNMTLLQEAILRSSTTNFSILLEYVGEALYVKDRDGSTVLHTAARFASGATLSVLLLCWDDDRFDMHNNAYETVFDIIDTKGAFDALTTKWYSKSVYCDISTIFKGACNRQNVDLALHIIRASSSCPSLLPIACNYGSGVEVVNALLERIDDEDLYHVDCNGYTALALACTSRRVDVVSILLQRWSDEALYSWRCKERGRCSLLHFTAITKSCEEVFKILLERWTDEETLYGSNENNHTILYALCKTHYYGTPEDKEALVMALLTRWTSDNHEAYGRAINGSMRTALHVCCQQRMVNVAYLISTRMTADQRVQKDKDGNAARDLLHTSLLCRVFPSKAKRAEIG